MRGLLPVKVQMPAMWYTMAAPGVRWKRPIRFVILAGSARILVRGARHAMSVNAVCGG